jgi:hypothetical protein
VVRDSLCNGSCRSRFLGSIVWQSLDPFLVFFIKKTASTAACGPRVEGMWQCIWAHSWLKHHDITGKCCGQGA